MSIDPAVKDRGAAAEVSGALVVKDIGAAGNTIKIFSIPLSKQSDGDSLIKRGAASAGLGVDLDGVNQDLSGGSVALVRCCLAEVARFAVSVLGTPTQVITSPVTTDRVEVRAVGSGGTAWLAVLSIAPVAGLMVGWGVGASLIETRTQFISVVTAQVFDTAIVTIADVSIFTVFVSSAATQVFCSSMATDGELLRTVGVSAATVSTLEVVHITVVAVLVIRDMAHLSAASTQ